ncbi:MAG: SLC13 family permease [Alphaproteobacteria bacterium]|nr:SLC13 family permease [Alphaproteobacteria bacterium]
MAIFEHWEIFLVYALIIGVFTSFILEKLPPDVTAMSALIILIGFGILDSKEALSVFSNPAPVTIGAMFIISAALERTGCIELLGRFIEKMSGKGQVGMMLAVMPIALIISAFMNNTPVVIVLVPVIISLCRKMQVSSSKLLIPLSYAAILGGTCTLIGTSTNLLVNGIAIENGVEGFGMFEITLPGLIMAAVGFVYIFLFGRHLLPERTSLADLIGGSTGKQYIAQLCVPQDSKLVGRPLRDSLLTKGGDTHIIDVIRSGDSMRDYLDDLDLKAGDRVVLETNVGEILGIKETGAVSMESTPGADHFIEGLDPISASENVVAEGIVGHNSNLIGKMRSGLDFRRRYGVYVVGVHKPQRHPVFRADRETLGMSDTLLLEGPITGMQLLFQENGLINLTLPEDRPIRRSKAPIALLTIAAVAGLAALNIMPIALLAIVGAGVVVVTRCLDPRDIYKSVDWPIIFLIFGMLGLAQGMEKTGAAMLIVDYVVSFADSYGPITILAVFYILTSALTETVSNNAVAALLTPIAIGVAHSLGLDPKPFLVAVMFAASASFATPVGYQTNTFVYGAGGYKFRDFIVIGLPLNVLMFIAAVLIIPQFWGF